MFILHWLDLLCQNWGRFPEEGDAVNYKGYNFVVEAMERFRIQMVRIQRIEQASQEPEDG